ncbi:MAG: Ku protein [Dehalococcoidia bacterium]
MPRSIWRGVISFGMVSIPVKLYTATESKDISFRQLHDDECQSRIRQLRWCPVHDREVEYGEIVRGYEYAKDHYVVLDEEDFESLPLPSKHTIALDAFVHSEEIDPIYYEKSYYLEPDEAGVKPFALLMRALQEKELVAVAKIAIRNKERICALRPQDGALTLETMFLEDEIREAPNEVPWQEQEVSDAEMQMAFTLIDMLAKPFEPEAYHDNYREALMEVINAKLEGQEVITAAEPEAPKVVDLMAALRASVEAAKATQAPAARAEDDESEEEAAGESPKKRSRSRAKAS